MGNPDKNVTRSHIGYRILSLGQPELTSGCQSYPDSRVRVNLLAAHAQKDFRLYMEQEVELYFVVLTSIETAS